MCPDISRSSGSKLAEEAAYRKGRQMNIDADMLPKIATVLEKVADYLENAEAQKVAKEQSRRSKAAHNLAEKLSTATGERIDEKTVEKLAHLDPEVAEMIGKFAGEETGVDSMGGPEEQETVKTASEGGNPADARFISWVTGP